MSFSDSQVMLDTEALSTRSNAAIVSIGAVKFCLNKGIISSFKINIDPKSCKQYGMHIDASTVDWWFQQTKEARDGWMKSPVSIGEGLQYFQNWYGDKSRITWVKGASFDFPILENAFRVLELKNPIKYWHQCCYRTIINTFGIDDRKMKSEGSTYHDAVSDCEEQCKVLIPLLQAIKGE
jgi:hypothetical protein